LCFLGLDKKMGYWPPSIKLGFRSRRPHIRASPAVPLLSQASVAESVVLPPITRRELMPPSEPPPARLRSNDHFWIIVIVISILAIAAVFYLSAS
jgi:hypothetical protein